MAQTTGRLSLDPVDPLRLGLEAIEEEPVLLDGVREETEILLHR